MHAHMAQKVPKDGIEHVQWYLRSQVHQPKHIGVDDYIKYLQKINKCLTLLPIIRDLKGVPKEIEFTDKSSVHQSISSI